VFGYQVCVADALYMLLGVTPANEGAEVRCMLQMWREKNLTLGSSIVAEMNYMSNNVWTPSGLCEATKLIEILGPIKRVGYVRDPANVPLALLRKQTDSLSVGPIYSFNEPMPQIACPHIDIEEKVKATASSTVAQKLRRVADFDHAAGQGPGPDEKSVDSASLVDEQSDFFSAAAKDDSSSSMSNVRHLRQLSAASTVRARTISARDLVQVLHTFIHAAYVWFIREHTNDWNLHLCWILLVRLLKRLYFVQIDTLGGGGYGVVRIVPGLHPVLRSPGDSCSIPVWQQKSLGRNRDSIEKSHGISHSKIEAIFSNNGATWDHLNQLPTGSTLMGNGFYLRKSIEGSWVLLVGAGSQESLDNPPYLLWSVLDTARLAALDFDDRVCVLLRVLMRAVCDFKRYDSNVQCH